MTMAKESFRDSHRFTLRALGQALLAVYGLVLYLSIAGLVLFGLYYAKLDGNRLLDLPEVISLLVAEVPLGLGLWWMLGERKRGRLSDAKANIEFYEAYGHLVVHYWYLFNVKLIQTGFYVVENPNTHTAYDCPSFIGELANLGVIHKVQHKSEPAMRDFLKAKGTMIVNREATFVELR